MKEIEFAPAARAELDAAAEHYDRDRGDVLRVEVVAHVRRRPGYWLTRLK